MYAGVSIGCRVPCARAAARMKRQQERTLHTMTNTQQLSLADAIRLGAAISPASVGMFYNPDTQGTCALGSAWLAVGGEFDVTKFAYWLLKSQFPELQTRIPAS